MIVDSHPVNPMVAKAEEATMHRLFDQLYSFYQDRLADTGPGLVLYMPQDKVEVGYASKEDMENAPPAVREIMKWFESVMPDDGNSVPAAFVYRNGGVSAYITTGLYGAGGVETKILHASYHMPTPVATAPSGEIRPWEIDL